MRYLASWLQVCWPLDIWAAKPFKYDGPSPSPVIKQHADQITAIRQGKRLNEGPPSCFRLPPRLPTRVGAAGKKAGGHCGKYADVDYGPNERVYRTDTEVGLGGKSQTFEDGQVLIVLDGVSQGLQTQAGGNPVAAHRAAGIDERSLAVIDPSRSAIRPRVCPGVLDLSPVRHTAPVEQTTYISLHHLFLSRGFGSRQIVNQQSDTAAPVTRVSRCCGT